MTPQDNAAQIMRQFDYLFKVNNSKTNIVLAQNCAILVCNEVISALQGNMFVKSQIKYWEQTKSEIEKI